MKFKIGDRVRTTNKHDKLYDFSFEGKIDDIQSSIVIVIFILAILYPVYSVVRINEIKALRA